MHGSIALVLPIHNEAEALPGFLAELLAALAQLPGIQWHVIGVDDGSQDHSPRQFAETMATSGYGWSLIRLSRNFGHQAALSAGLDIAMSSLDPAAIITMDADGQDPPAVLADFIAQWQQGAPVVVGRRHRREGDPLSKRLSAWAFYRLLNFVRDADVPVLPDDSGDFRLLDARVARALQAVPEPHRYLRGMIGWLGYPTATVDYVRPSRLAGNSKYNWLRMTGLAMDALLAFSKWPLRVIGAVSTCMFLASLLGIAWVVIDRLSGHAALPGWASLMATVLALGGLQLLCLGVLGLYIGRLLDEVRRRPRYIVADWHGQQAAVVATHHLNEATASHAP